MRIPPGIVSTFFLLTGVAAFAQQYNISTVAGGAPQPTTVPALNAPLSSPGALTVDQAGNVYFVSDDCVFRIDLNGNLNRIAGNSRIGFSGDGGQATLAQLNNPGGLAIDTANNLYIADSGNNRIRKVVVGTGVISTIAGLAVAGYSGDNGIATAALLNNPQGLAVDVNGNLYIADTGNHAIRKITTNSGVITTVAGNGTQGTSVDGTLATNAQLNAPQGVAVDSLLNIYIADSGNNRIRKVQSGIMLSIAGNGVGAFQGDGGPATAASLNLPTAVVVDLSGNVYVVDYNNHLVRKISTSGLIATVTGLPSGISQGGLGIDPGGNLYLANSALFKVLRYSPSAGITIIGGTGTAYYLGDGGLATSAQLVQPQGLAVDSSGIVYIADRGEAGIRKFFPGANITSPPGATALGPAAVAVDTAGNLYIADAVGNTVTKVTPTGAFLIVAGTVGVAGFNGDNGTASFAQLSQPSGVAVDASGNVYIADTGNNRIRKVTLATGLISTIAGNGSAAFGGDGGAATGALVNQPTGISLDSAGNLYVADTGNNRIRKISALGVITTVAGNGNKAATGDGGSAAAAALLSPHGVAVDTLGNLYVTDYSGRVRKVSISGTITTIAGNGTSGYSGDGGSAVNAQLSLPWGITVDAGGLVYVSDVGEQAIRLLSPVAASALSVTTTDPLPSGTVGVPYAQTLTASGGTPPYSWSVVFGTLPSGLTLSPSGSITGTPNANGSFLLRFQVTDSASVTSQAQIGIVIVPAAAGGLAISTPPTLVPGAVGVNYAQILTAVAGNPPYAWALIGGALPTGVTLSPNGILSGTPSAPGTFSFTIRLNDNSGTITTQTFSLTVISVGTLSRTGVLGHIAAGATWTTKVYLTNISSSALALNLILHDDNGNPLTLPMNVTQQGSAQLINAQTLSAVMNPNTSIIIDTGALLGNLSTGWIDVLSSGTAGSLAGFAVFRTASGTSASEGTTQLQTTFESKMDLQFDNTGGFNTSVAVANLSPSPANVTATVFDINGNQIGTYTLPQPLAGYGHTAFVMPSQFAVTANQQGIVQFSSPGGSLGGVGLRASTTTGTFTSVPVILP